MQPRYDADPGDNFIKIAVRSGLLDAERFQAALKRVPAGLRARPDLLAEYFVRTGILTQFQAIKLLQGAERGLVLGPYHMLAPLGRGAMGSVYLARDSRDQRLVALKILPPSKYREEERLLTRFRREMELCQKVSHPHLTRTFEVGVVQHVYYIAMEYVPGTTLRRKVMDEGPLPVHRAARVFAEVASALGYAHSQGLIHRDLKPSNIMLTPNGHSKILDLGLALIEGEELPEDKSILGGQGYVVGTMDFIAPEQVADPTGVDARADLYSLGCSLYFVLTGQPPFPGGTSQQKIKRHLTESPLPISELNPTVPAAFVKLAERLMAKKPEERPDNAEDVRRFMLYWVGDEPELPIDVAVDNSNPREIFDLELDQKAEGSFWETVSVIAFVGKSHRPKAAPRHDDPVQEASLNWPMLLGGLAVAGMFVVAVLIAVVYVLSHRAS
jgi:serine/threonine protein kinase